MSETPRDPNNPNEPLYPNEPNQPYSGDQNPPPPPLFNDTPPPQYGDPVGTPPPGVPPHTPPPGVPPATPTPNYNPPPPPNTGAPTKDERNWAMFAHLSALVVGLIGMATSLPAFGFIGPLVIYLMKKDESAFIGDQAKEALNFNITVGLAMLIMWVLTIVLVWTVIVPILMIFAMAVVGIGALVFVIIASVKAADGERYRYPINWRIIN